MSGSALWVLAVLALLVGCARDGAAPGPGAVVGDVGLDAPCGVACGDASEEAGDAAGDSSSPDVPMDAVVVDAAEDGVDEPDGAHDAADAPVDVVEEVGDVVDDGADDADASSELPRIAGLIALHEYTLVAPTNPRVRKLVTTLAVFAEGRPRAVHELDICSAYEFGSNERPSPTFSAGRISVGSDVLDFVLEPSVEEGQGVVYTSTLSAGAVELFDVGEVTFGVEGGELDAALLMHVQTPPEPGYLGPETGCRLGDEVEVSWSVVDPAVQLSIEIIPLDQFLQPKPGRALRCPLSPDRASFTVPGEQQEVLPMGAYALLVSRRVEVLERVGRDAITFTLGSTEGVVCWR